MKIVDDLRNFALRGNVIDLVVGFTVGAAFTTIAKSLVGDIIMPPVGVVLGDIDFADLYVVLKGPEDLAPGLNVDAAKAAGAVTLNYGLFLNNVIAFVLVTLVMFFLIRMIQRAEEFAKRGAPAPAATTRPCPYCCSEIAIAATRCPNCTSQLG
jgi:large conductance mechanosensitive channel